MRPKYLRTATMWTESFGVRLHSLHHVHPVTIRFRMCVKQGTCLNYALPEPAWCGKNRADGFQAPRLRRACSIACRLRRVVKGSPSLPSFLGLKRDKSLSFRPITRRELLKIATGATASWLASALRSGCGSGGSTVEGEPPEERSRKPSVADWPSLSHLPLRWAQSCWRSCLFFTLQEWFVFCTPHSMLAIRWC